MGVEVDDWELSDIKTVAQEGEALHKGMTILQKP